MHDPSGGAKIPRRRIRGKRWLVDCPDSATFLCSSEVCALWRAAREWRRGVADVREVTAQQAHQALRAGAVVDDARVSTMAADAGRAAHTSIDQATIRAALWLGSVRGLVRAGVYAVGRRDRAACQAAHRMACYAWGRSGIGYKAYPWVQSGGDTPSDHVCILGWLIQDRWPGPNAGF